MDFDGVRGSPYVFFTGNRPKARGYLGRKTSRFVSSRSAYIASYFYHPVNPNIYLNKSTTLFVIKSDFAISGVELSME